MVASRHLLRRTQANPTLRPTIIPGVIKMEIVCRQDLLVLEKVRVKHAKPLLGTRPVFVRTEHITDPFAPVVLREQRCRTESAIRRPLQHVPVRIVPAVPALAQVPLLAAVRPKRAEAAAGS